MYGSYLLSAARPGARTLIELLVVTGTARLLRKLQHRFGLKTKNHERRLHERSGTSMILHGCSIGRQQVFSQDCNGKRLKHSIASPRINNLEMALSPLHIPHANIRPSLIILQPDSAWHKPIAHGPPSSRLHELFSLRIRILRG